MTRSVSHDHDAREGLKATLYCWGCDHASPVDGDWIRRPRGSEVAYVCPDCGTVIARRRREDDDPSPGEAWGRVVRTSVSVWQASVGFGSTAPVRASHRRDNP
ncbi:hypothetical protein [Natronococcus occultus]|uniref:DUF8106 domain-containing protein n=1 Tax=Natronococcus occultus SP4 TaxID=694430 RepID=L0K255_9EURY|nr:hypothetical protein [Natronococcus occultus]AGB39086.1 hypothetical protein Natoc_3354 [Natronococcus occultus SP4]